MNYIYYGNCPEIMLLRKLIFKTKVYIQRYIIYLACYEAVVAHKRRCLFFYITFCNGMGDVVFTVSVLFSAFILKVSTSCQSETRGK